MLEGKSGNMDDVTMIVKTFFTQENAFNQPMLEPKKKKINSEEKLKAQNASSSQA